MLDIEVFFSLERARPPAAEAFRVKLYVFV